MAEKKLPKVELSTVLFYRGEIPKEIALSDCSFPMARSPRKAFSGLYGLRGKQDGFVAARAYAASIGVKYTVIDVVIELEKQLTTPLKPEELAESEFLNISRISRGLAEDIRLWLSPTPGEVGEGSTKPPVTKKIRVADWIEQNPALIDALIEVDDCRHLKVIAYHAATMVGDRPIAIGSLPYRHWGAIREATCRLNPTVHISLELPI